MKEKEKHAYQPAYISVPIEAIVNNQISLIERQLLGLILILSGTKRGCWASNDYLAASLGAHYNTVSNGIRNLTKQGYVTVTTVRSERRVFAHPKYKEMYRPAVEYFYEEMEKGNYVGLRDRLEQVLKNLRTGSQKFKNLHQENRDKTSTKSQGSKQGKSCYNIEDKEEEEIKISSPSLSDKIDSLTKVKENSLATSKADNNIDEEQRNAKLRDKIREKVNGSRKKWVPSELAESVVNSWKEACDGKLVQHEKNSKRYEMMCRMIDQMTKGLFFVNDREFPELKDYKFKKKDFELAFSRLGKAAFDPNCEVEAGSGYKQFLQKINLNKFLYNSQGANKKQKSLFIHFFQNEPTKLTERQTTTIEETPTVKVLINGFKSLTNMNGQNFTMKQKRDFSFTEKRLREYTGKNKQNIVNFTYWKELYGCADDTSLMAVFLLDSLKELKEKEDINFSTGWLCSDLTIGQRLPDYLKSKGLYRKLQFGEFSS